MSSDFNTDPVLAGDIDRIVGRLDDIDMAISNHLMGPKEMAMEIFIRWAAGQMHPEYASAEAAREATNFANEFFAELGKETK